MGGWWQDDIVAAGKLPLLMCTIAFVVTFVTTRVIVRMIRAGRGPFSNNSVGGVHVHHIVPGIGLMIVGGLFALGADPDGWQAVAGAVFGVGLALVLDEFALVLHLQDVYWEEEGRLSVDIVFVLAGVMALLLVLGSPFGVEDQTGGEVTARVGVMSLVVVHLLACVVAATKGKVGTAVAGLFLPFVAYIGAVRIARPGSPWARRRYARSPRKEGRAELREARFDVRWRSKIDRLQDLVAGSPSGEGPGPRSGL